jgi:hypothetical protein
MIFANMERAKIQAYRNEIGWPVYDEYSMASTNPGAGARPYRTGYTILAPPKGIEIDFWIRLKPADSDKILDWFGMPMERVLDRPTNGPVTTVRIIFNNLLDSEVARAFYDNLGHLSYYEKELTPEIIYRQLKRGAKAADYEGFGPGETDQRVVAEFGAELIGEYVERLGGDSYWLGTFGTRESYYNDEECRRFFQEFSSRFSPVLWFNPSLQGR